VTVLCFLQQSQRDADLNAWVITRYAGLSARYINGLFEDESLKCKVDSPLRKKGALPFFSQHPEAKRKGVQKDLKRAQVRCIY